ncbi:23S rRNA pseudouridine(2605) synthase RluB [Cysteiniphilum sp. QT6929]|uniref:23S rRNA pseudouridine(2605) synthase RluB n=1 Tax=Cysteiniphilum sp. QT6929 TaxID=2975055 RepID=UPI0024B3C45C|nr:23S rRNA pseudouridine(2605) synthase RluB [Cysteiniphilum sp. QT6929]WHN66344.1 23S rRNA pseudouridine(2605) synthase RluB [Cysteiniphilum sp. QT6929]
MRNQNKQNKRNNQNNRTPKSNSDHKDKLQKLLALAGLGSRRKMEEKILAGRVSVNGKVAQIGDRASFDDKIIVDGKPLRNQAVVLSRPRVIIYNKPDGEICTKSDPEGRKTVFDALPRLKIGRWIMVGRLDINTTGLLLFTTDGELANRLMHPSYEVEREYAVRLFGDIEDSVIEQLKMGIMLDDGEAKFSSVRFVGGEGINKWYHVTLSEGRNREVRRMFEAVGVQISRLTRVRYGNLTLPRYLSAGKSEELSPQDVNALRQSVQMRRFYFPKSLLDKLDRKR